MRVIIAGSRTIADYDIVRKAIYNALWDWRWTYESVTEVVSGTAFGVDRLGEMWAVRNNKKIAYFPANWDKYGKKAGYMRNAEMANYADALIAIWDGKSRGTKMMIDLAKKKGLKVFIHEIKTA